MMIVITHYFWTLLTLAIMTISLISTILFPFPFCNHDRGRHVQNYLSHHTSQIILSPRRLKFTTDISFCIRRHSPTMSRVAPHLLRLPCRLIHISTSRGVAQHVNRPYTFRIHCWRHSRFPIQCIVVWSVRRKAYCLPSPWSEVEELRSFGTSDDQDGREWSFFTLHMISIPAYRERLQNWDSRTISCVSWSATRERQDSLRSGADIDPFLTKTFSVFVFRSTTTSFRQWINESIALTRPKIFVEIDGKYTFDFYPELTQFTAHSRTATRRVHFELMDFMSQEMQKDFGSSMALFLSYHTHSHVAIEGQRQEYRLQDDIVVDSTLLRLLRRSDYYVKHTRKDSITAAHQKNGRITLCFLRVPCHWEFS